MKGIPSLAEQRVFVRSLDNERTSDVPKRIENEEDDCDFEGMVIAEKIVTCSIRGKL